MIWGRILFFARIIMESANQYPGPDEGDQITPPPWVYGGQFQALQVKLKLMQSLRLSQPYMDLPRTPNHDP